MKTGRTLTQLAQELERQRDVKKDYIAGTGAMTMTADAKALELVRGGVPLAPMPMTDHARKQLATRLEVPTAFYDRLESKHPDLLSGMVNALFRREPQALMVRTLDERVRALMSNAYRPLDNFDLAEAVLPVLQEMGAEIASCELTEKKLYIKFLAPWLDRELPPPPGAVMGVGHTIFVRKIIGAGTIGNSEVGCGSIFVNPGFFEKQCTNLATFKDEGFGRMHVGRRNQVDEGGAWEYASDTTKKLADAQIWSQIRDVVRATLDGRVMDKIVNQLNGARSDAITGDPAKVVEVFAKKVGLSDDERGGVLRHLAQGGELSRYGLQWAVTRLAGEVDSYDRASELERLGGEVIELPRSDWQTIIKQAA